MFSNPHNILWPVNRNLIATGNATTDLYGRATVNAQALGDKAYFVQMYHGEDPSYKEITNLTAINVLSGILVANTNFTFADATDLWVVYKFENAPVVYAMLDFYARNLDTGDLIYLGSAETGTGGEAYLTDHSILNTLDVTPSNYEIVVKDEVKNITGNGTLCIFTRNATIGNNSQTINHGEDTNLTIDLIDLYNGEPISNRIVHVIIKDDAGRIVRELDVISDGNSQINIVVPNLPTGNYTVTTVFNSTLSYTNCSNVSAIEVVPSSKLNIDKVLNTIKDVYYIGDELVWTIEVSNIGEITANDVVVNDVPTNLAIVGYETQKGTFVNGVWNVGNLDVNEVAVLKVITKITQSNVAVSNTVNVTSSNYDNPYDANKTSNVTVTVAPSANVTIDKTVNDTFINVGDLVEWTIIVDHVSGDPIKGVTVNDILPVDKLNVIGWTAPAGTSFNNATKVWTIDNLNPTDSYVLKLVTKVLVSNQNITNYVTVTYKGNNSGVNNSNATISVLPASNLKIDKVIVDPKDVYVLGDEIKWTITVENVGEDTATDVVVIDTSKGLVVVSAVASQGTFNSGTWNIGRLPVNTPVTLELTTKVVASDIVGWNYVNVSTTAHDVPGNNKTRNVTFTVLPHADVTIDKVIDGANVVAIGDNVIWIITVEHVSGDALTNVVVSDKLPAGLNIVDVIAPAGTSFNNATKVWTINSLNDVDNVYVLKLVTNVAVSDANLTNGVVVSYNGTNGRSNSSNATVTVLPNADIAVDINVDKNVVVIGDTVVWTITVSNNGPDDIKNISVVDVLPNGLTNVVTSGVIADNTVSWNIDLANGESKILTITAKVAVSDTVLENKVSAKFNGTDPEPLNNNASVNITVLPDAKVNIDKVIDGDKVVALGDNVTWIIKVEHVSGDALTKVTVRDVIPEGLELVEFVAPQGTSFDATTGIWTIDNLDDQKSTYELVLVTKTVISDANITNCANVSYNGSNTGKNSSNATVVVLPHTDLEVSVEVVPNETQINGVVDWVITVVNNGNDTAPLVEVNITLPEGVSLVDVVLPDGTVFNNESGIWSIPKLAVGQNMTLSLTTLVNVTNTTLTGNANVTYNGTFASNKTEDNATLNVLPSADLNVVITFDKDKVTVGDEVKVTVVLDNYGPDVAENTVVTIKLPDGFVIKSFNTESGTYVPEENVWILGNITPGQYVLEIVGVFTKAGEFNVTASVNTTTPIALNATGNLTSVDNISVDEKHVNPGNNTHNNCANNGLKGNTGMIATGNPLVAVLLALLLIPVSIRRRK